MCSGCVKALLAVVLLAATGAVAADGFPMVTEIRFEGNRVTRDDVLLREMDLAVGDPADPARLTNSHQAIRDLGLFRKVDARFEYTAEGAVAIVRVREKRFILPIPRIGGSSDGDGSLGAQLRWANVRGYNHTFIAFAETGRSRGRVAERQSQARLAYQAPHLWADRYGLEVVVDHTTRDANGPSGLFDERLDRFELRVWRDARDNRPRSGWNLGAGLAWQRQYTDGALAPLELGQATAAIFSVDYSDLRYHLYSESGHRIFAKVELARDGWGSDYSYSQLHIDYLNLHELDGGPHRNRNVLLAGGWAEGGSPWRNAFSLGGSLRMRGYELDFVEGSWFAYAAVEYVRPIRFNWLRLLLIGEAGMTGGSINGAPDGGPFANVGVGVRVRLPWFVNVELELGVAYPLRKGDGFQFFAGGAR